MKKMASFALIAAAMSTTAFAAVPFTDDFDSSGPIGDWIAEGAFGSRGDFETVDATTENDWRGTAIGAPADNTDGYIGKLSWVADTLGTVWRTAGEETDADYIVEADVFIPVVDAAAPPDDYLYQGLLFYVNAGGYGRFHAHWNTDSSLAGLEDGPRMRVQTTTGGFNTPLLITSPADFTAAEGWHKMKVDLVGDQFTVSLDGTVVGTGTIDASHSPNGQFGIMTFIDGASSPDERAVYVDNFSATAQPQPTDVQAENWTAYE